MSVSRRVVRACRGSVLLVFARGSDAAARFIDVLDSDSFDPLPKSRFTAFAARRSRPSCGV